MNFLKTMDLYKGIVLISVILLPLGGWWVTKIDANIAACQKAIHNATRSGGFMEKIGSLQKQIEIVAQNSRSTTEAITSPAVYFQGQIIAAAQLGNNDFNLTPVSQESARMTGRQQAWDHVIGVKFKGLKVKMDFVYAVLFNCESGANDLNASAGQSVWRLRNLTLENVTGEAFRGGKVPDPELQDEWQIKDMKFARREPKIR